MHESEEVPEIPKSMRQLEVLISAGTQSPQGLYQTKDSIASINEHHLLVIDTLE